MNAVVNCYNQLAAWKQGRFMMRNMENIDVIPAEQCWDSPIIDPESLSLRLIQLLEIRRQWSELMQMAARAEQEIFISRVERGDIADEVPDISANAEFIDLPNIDRDSHSRSTQV